MAKKIEELESKTMQEGFWNDNKRSSVVLQELKTLKGKYENFSRIKGEIANLEELNELLLLEEDEELGKDLLKNTKLGDMILNIMMKLREEDFYA